MTVVMPAAKPRLLFIQWDHCPNAGLTDYLVTQVNDHVRCLAEYFDVSTVNRDADYNELCDRYRPDMILVESGYQTTVSRRPTISSINKTDGIPKLGFHNADSWSDCRAGFLSDMDHWGIDTSFSICATTAEYMPEIADQLFIWPNFINPEIFRDYGLEKSIPVMLSGQRHEQYPWRQQVFPFVSQMLPCLICPQFHHGSGLSHRMLIGEGYARSLNASKLSLTCGTMAKEVVRKHFEIPGANSCLVCEPSPHLIDAGFRHLENCAFADPKNVVDVIDHLLGNPDLLTRITSNGHNLVHEHHTLRHRPQIYQWFTLQAQLKEGERIVQATPFSSLSVVTAAASSPVALVRAIGTDRIHLRRGREYLQKKKIDSARREFDEALSYVRYLPEAHLGLALCHLAEGDAKSARAIVAKLIEYTTISYGAADPDPVEWAIFIVSLIAQGEVAKAGRLINWYPDLSHSELSHVFRGLQLIGCGDLDTPQKERPTRKSIHALGERSFESWADWFSDILQNCGQQDLLIRLNAARSGQFAKPVLASKYSTGPRRTVSAAWKAMLHQFSSSSSAAKPPPSGDFRRPPYFRRMLMRKVTQTQLGTRIRQMWRAHRANLEQRSLREQVGSERR